MNQPILTHNAYHLGDNLVHLNFLRRVARANPDRQFVHRAQWRYLKQLHDVIFDVPNIGLGEFTHLLPGNSINAWRGARQFWYEHTDRLDFVKFHIEAWFPRLAEQMGVENPIKTTADMLFDYSAITESRLPPGFDKPFDVLVINSPPGSGQWQEYNAIAIGALAKDIARKGKSVIATDPVIDRPDSPFVPITSERGLSVTQIGTLSLFCHTILMVSTGPSWPTFNVFNQDLIKQRIILLDSERVNLAPNTVHCGTVTEAADELRKSGLL